MYKIISGATGTGKTQPLLAEYKRLVEVETVPSDKILLLLMNRSQSLSWRKNLDIKMYEGARHELFNEINREECFEDLYEWLKEIK